MHGRKLGVVIALLVSISGASFASVAAARSVSSIGDADAERAGFLVGRARACHENKGVLDAFAKNVLILTGNENAPADKSTDEDEFITEAGARFLDTITCPVQTGRSCPPNPYSKMSCRRFLHLFRNMKITRSDWQVSQGFR